MKNDEPTAEDIKLINDNDKLIEIIRNQDLDIRIRIHAVEMLKDKSVFRDYVHDEDSFLRSQAARFTDDYEILLDMVLNDSSDHVKHIAAMRFVCGCDIEKYEDILVEIAVENPKYGDDSFQNAEKAARFASSRIEDPSKLLKVIKKSSSLRVWRYAIGKLDNDALYELLENNGLDAEKALTAIEKLNDRVKLKELLYSGKLDYESEVSVAMELEDDEKLKELLNVTLGLRVIEGKAFPDIYPGDGIYTSIVFSYPNEEIAIAALNNIGYEKNLKHIIKHHDNPRIRDLAEERLKNQ